MPLPHPPARTMNMLAVLLGLGCVFGCDDGTPTESFELSGRVLDNESGDGIGNARVFFTSDTLYQADTRTDDDGEYALGVESDTPFGQVRAERDGYRPKEETVFFDSPERRIDLRLLPSRE